MTSTDEKFWHAYIENFKTLKKICQRMHTKQKCKSNFSKTLGYLRERETMNWLTGIIMKDS